MSGSVAAPVIVGLAVGITLIVLLSLIFGVKAVTVPPPLNKVYPLILIPNSGGNESTFVPRVMKVIIGINNTVTWQNNDPVPTWLTADNQADPDFFNVTKDGIPLSQNNEFDFTFMKAGEFGYHGKPWQRGTVIVIDLKAA